MRNGIVLREPRKTGSRIFASKCGCNCRHIRQPRLRYPGPNWFASLEGCPRGWIKNSIFQCCKLKLIINRLDKKTIQDDVILLIKDFSGISKHIFSMSRVSDWPLRLYLLVLLLQPCNWIRWSAKIVLRISLPRLHTFLWGPPFLVYLLCHRLQHKTTMVIYWMFFNFCLLT